jgi:hypothetical protein
MNTLPWVTITCSNSDSALRVHPQAFNELKITKHESKAPQLVAFVGKQEKSHILQQYISTEYPPLPHGQVYLWTDRESQDADTPIIYLDCELFSHNSTQSTPPISYVTPELSSSISWLDFGDKQKIPTYFGTNIILPLSSLVYYFSKDLGGLRGVSRIIARQILAPQTYNIPHIALPRLVIVTEIEDACSEQVMSLVYKAIEETSQLEPSRIYQEIKSRVHSIQLLYYGQLNRKKRSLVVRQHIIRESNPITLARRSVGLLFQFPHLEALSTILFEKFCKNPEDKFSFVKNSRPIGFSITELPSHLDELLNITPSEAWLWHFIAPLIASTILVANYPPDAPRNYPLRL